MISLPIKVAYATVPVRPLSPKAANSAGAWGLYESVEHAISIRSDLPAAEQARILIHEIIHAAFDAFDLPTDKLDEERVCEVLDGPLLTILTDNPWLPGVLHQAVTKGVPIVKG